ncbi:hypothetical protein RFI_30531 [Reticulomyxa filosa]|uniref:NACHT domain-containing protein n=1 Tax=Reticulomyxa filosa TaxID=46433 RepID=X6LZ31_RETFI|nr:hypothetical protein RFI_30531 [Reticulomyxa filosa]|eukprot:ETO06859.1 hypothetical protein RFI_30531 [Reticulomyxa filosa]
MFVGKALQVEERKKHGKNRKTTKKLKDYYNGQDKLVPLFDDPPQSIDDCYIRLVLLTQQQFQNRKDQMTKKNNEEKEDEKWPDTLDYSLIYDNKQEIIELEDIWKKRKKEEEKSELEMHHISIHGEAGTGKSVLTQRIAYLWANKQMWNDKFQWLLHIPLRRIANIFDKLKDRNDNNIESQWSKK